MAKWNIDPVHSSVEFSVKHLGISWVKGRFTVLSGEIQFDPKEIAKSEWVAQIEAKSVWTGIAALDAHLKTKDFFDADNHPLITFKSESVEKTDDNHFTITGPLTLRGVTKPTTFEAEYMGNHEAPEEDGNPAKTVAGFQLKTVINRHDFNVSWDKPAGNGKTTVGGDVHITINVEAVQE